MIKYPTTEAANTMRRTYNMSQYLGLYMKSNAFKDDLCDVFDVPFNPAYLEDFVDSLGECLKELGDFHPMDYEWYIRPKSVSAARANIEVFPEDKNRDLWLRVLDLMDIYNDLFIHVSW